MTRFTWLLLPCVLAIALNVTEAQNDYFQRLFLWGDRHDEDAGRFRYTRHHGHGRDHGHWRRGHPRHHHYYHDEDSRSTRYNPGDDRNSYGGRIRDRRHDGPWSNWNSDSTYGRNNDNWNRPSSDNTIRRNNYDDNDNWGGRSNDVRSWQNGDNRNRGHSNNWSGRKRDDREQGIDDIRDRRNNNNWDSNKSNRLDSNQDRRDNGIGNWGNDGDRDRNGNWVGGKTGNINRRDYDQSSRSPAAARNDEIVSNKRNNARREINSKSNENGSRGLLNNETYESDELDENFDPPTPKKKSNAPNNLQSKRKQNQVNNSDSDADNPNTGDRLSDEKNEEKDSSSNQENV